MSTVLQIFFVFFLENNLHTTKFNCTIYNCKIHQRFIKMHILRQLRKDAKRTQQQMADVLGITQQAYAAYENDKSSPPKDVLEKIADYFHVSTDYLLGREEKSSPAGQESGGIVIPEKYKDIAVAFHGGADNLTQADIDDIVRFIEFTKSKKKQ